MTFSIIARCSRTGMFGIGGLVVQANGDPRLGPLGLRLLEMGYSAEKVLSEIASSDGTANMPWRQIAVVDKDGLTAAHTGSSNEEWKGHVAGEGFVALGNRLTSDLPSCVAAVESVDAPR